MSLLALDVGNTNITAGVFQGKKLIRQWRHETKTRFLSRELRSKTRGAGVNAAVYGSVVPAINRSLEKAVRESFGCKPVAVSSASPLGIRFKVDHPRQVGADRVLNALAVHELAKGSAVVVDFGTATTFDCVSQRGDYLGGAILPGPNLAARMLHEHTAQLPLAPLRRPTRAIGKNTNECIQAGLYFGYLGMIEKVLALTLREMGGAGARRARVLVTGGLAGLFMRDLGPSIRHVPDLTLQGLRIAFERISLC